MSTRLPIVPPPPDAPPELLDEIANADERPDVPNTFAELQSDYVLFLIIGLAFLVDVALLIYLFARFEFLPDPIPLHFDASGFPDRIEAKNGIFGLPVIGAIVFGLNTTLGIFTYRWQRAAALLLAAGALIVQILMWFAVVSIVGGIY